MSHAAYQGAGLKVGLDIWRIEKMEPVHVEAKLHGQFYSGDCYIVLKTYKPDPTRSTYEYDLFFWLGKDSSQDEQGAVAYHTVTLDDQFGGKPIQYREVQGFESTKFMAAFPKGVQYLDGGVASAFKHVDGHYEPHLYHVKGKRNVRVQQVPMNADSMNDGDVFILDTKEHVYQFNGKDANRYEKAKGLEYASKLKNDNHGGKADMVVIESGAKHHEHHEDEFWKLLGGHKAIKSAEAGGTDDDNKQRCLQLFSVGQDGSFSQVAQDKLEKKMLDTNGTFVVYNGSEVFVWVGKGAPKDQRKSALTFGSSFLKSQNLAGNTPVSRVLESGETPQFKAQFHIFDPPKVVDTQEHKKIQAEKAADTSELYKRRARDDEKLGVTDGKVEIWRIENMKKVAQSKEQFGQFFMGDSYIILFTYKSNTKDKYIIYFWQGRDSSNDEKGASALLAKHMDDELNGEAAQVRVVQGKEPNHFLALFKGKMVIHSGGHASAFKNRSDHDSYDTSGVALYHVRGTSALNTRASQVNAVPASLNSGDCFVLLTSDKMYVWNGSGSNHEEKQHAESIAKSLQHKRTLVDINEGHESEDFWHALGGQGEYPKTKTLEEGHHEPRLFQVHDHSGGIRVEEIFDFSQDDLIQEDVMILDTYDEVYVWIGRDSNQKEKDGALKAALDYVQNAPDGRSADTPVFRVTAGTEPPSFTCCFLGWSESKALDFSDPYLKKLGQVQGTAGHGEHKAGPQRVTAVQSGPAKPTKFHTLDELKAGNLDDVDPSQKEQYLSDADFFKLFKCSKTDFLHLPAWKQAAKKKETGLF